MRFSTFLLVPFLLAGYAVAQGKQNVDHLTAREWSEQESAMAVRSETLQDFSTRELVEEVLERRRACPPGFYFDPPRGRCCSIRTRCG
ncbi:hypothetical protein FA15DRAFT_758321 [Coprinopsis marcescibilis]|uniref:Uncharacterized protein n=1 Tax=Coprinopsis marcescibilis TaxID=230819 RepID=A0A5C3KNG2_COPMA|nr:hypothetical protein FA15DRAFT_758321 [Coprinopsis marcescibilis]